MPSDIELLHAVATRPYSACEAQWQELLHPLHLSGEFVPAIQAVIREGRWKSRPNPLAYVRKAALRCAARLGITHARPRRHREILATDLHYKDGDGEPLGHDDRLGTALHLYDEKSGSGAGSGPGSNFEAIYDEDFITNRLPAAVLDENLEVKWDRVADLARMDAGERIVLELQRIGFGRDRAFAACYTSDDRKILQAAWKRFDRHKDILKEVLLSGRSLPGKSPQTIQREPVTQTQSATPELEMIFIELPQGGMKISFRKHVPEQQNKRPGPQINANKHE
jgi:hypothetical protein